MDKPILETYNLKKDYETPRGMLSILKGVEFRLYQGEMTFVVGKSGAGKSTLLHLLGGLDHATAGKVFFEGEDLSKMDEKELAWLRNRRIGFIFQFYYLLPELTLYENVCLPLMIAGNADKRWVQEILKRVRIWSRRDHYPSELSGGEKQRTAIARALVSRPSVVLCDEPTGNLDEETSESVYALLNELNQKDGQSFVIVTHDEEWAWRHTHILRLHDGVLFRGNRGEIQVEHA